MCIMHNTFEFACIVTLYEKLNYYQYCKHGKLEAITVVFQYLMVISPKRSQRHPIAGLTM